MLLIAYNTGLNFYVLYALQCKVIVKREKSRIGSSCNFRCTVFQNIYKRAYGMSLHVFDLIIWIQCKGIYANIKVKRKICAVEYL